jgi:hypothetical protein
MNIKRSIVILGLGAASCAGVYAWSSPENLQIYGPLHVGRSSPDLMSSHDDERFQVYFVDASDRLKYCEDAGCPDYATPVLDAGGHLYVLDVKGAKGLGVPRTHNGVEYGSAESLMVVSDAKGVVLAIFRDVTVSHLDLAVAAAQGKTRAIDKIRRGVHKAIGFWHDPQSVAHAASEAFDQAF